MKVRDIMSSRVISIGQDEPVSAAARLLKSANIGALPVCDGQRRLRGIVTDRDIVTRCVAPGGDPELTPVREIMSRGVVTCAPAEELDAAVKRMGEDQVRRLPVLDEGRLVGIVTLCDMARSSRCDMEAAAALTGISGNVRRMGPSR